MSNLSSITIPISTEYDNNYTKTLETQQIIGKVITDGIATFANGTVYNLNPPLLPQDAISKQYVIASSNPGAPANSVQFSNGGFAGSSNLLYDNGTNTLTISGDINLPPTTISGGVIDNLLDPISQQQIATKKYVDSFSSNVNTFYIQSDSPVTYTGNQMINSVIERNIFTATGKIGLVITDTTASATDLLAASPGATIGSTYKWKLINNDPNSIFVVDPTEGRDRFQILLNPGIGVTFDPATPSFPINRQYTLDATIVFTSIVPPAVTININRNFYSFSVFFWQDILSLNSTDTDFKSSPNLAITDNLLFNVNDTTINTTNYNYSFSDIRNGFISRNQIGVSNDALNIDISTPQIFTIQNNGTGNIILNPLTNLSILTPNPIVIPNGTQTTLSTNILSNFGSVSTPGNDYDILEYPTTGGTGNGMKVTTTITSPFNIISTGLLYDPNIVYDTIGGSGSGLKINVNSINVGGSIDSISSIFGYLDGYVIGDILTVVGGDNNGKFQFTGINSIDSFTVSTVGNGLYSDGDILTVINGTTNDGQVTLSAPFFNVLSIINSPL